MENVSKNVSNEVVFLSGNGNHQLGSKILKVLSEIFGQNCSFDHINYNKWPEPELDNRIVRHEKIAGKIVVFYQSIFNSELFEEALDLIWACKHQYGASYVIGIFPFLNNRRQDPVMKDTEIEKWSKKLAKPDEIQRLRKTIYFLGCAGVDEMIVATPHSIEMRKACNDYKIKFHEINPSTLFANAIQTFVQPEGKNLMRIYSPDEGSLARAVDLARIIDCPVLFNLKNRAINSITSIIETEKDEIEKLIGEFKKHFNFEQIQYATPDLVSQKIIIMIEDEVASGKTANDTGHLLKKYGAKSLLFFATHPVLTWGWRNKLFYNNPFNKIIMTDTIPRGYEKQTGGLIFDISLAPLFGSSLFQILSRM